MQGLKKLHLRDLSYQNIREDFIGKHCSKSEPWMTTENDGTVLDSQNLPNGKYMFKFQLDEGLDWATDLRKAIPFHFGSLMLSNSKRIMNDFIREIVDLKQTFWIILIRIVYQSRENSRTTKRKLDWLEKINVEIFKILKKLAFFRVILKIKIV